ncbi:marc-6, partial [Pristionchus pacificus]
ILRPKGVLIMDEPETSGVVVPFDNAHGDSVPPPSSDKHLDGEDDGDTLMCRVCRGDDGDLYYPCLCTGSIKYVHQECLLEWLKYSKKEVCELCNHKYSFEPIYRPDMPKALPIGEIIRGLLVSVRNFLKTWLIYTIVIIAWLGVVPITASRVFTAVFSGSIQSLLLLPLALISSEGIIHDVAKGCILLLVFVCSFISMLWLREQILHGGPAEWLQLDEEEEEEEGEAAPAQDGNAEEGGAAEGEEEEMEDEDEQPELEDAFEEEQPPAEGRVENMIRLARGMEDRVAAVVNAIVDAAVAEDEDPGNQLVPVEGGAGDGPNGAAAAEGDQAAGAAAAAPAGEGEWANNWERLGDELTWQRLLGLDGSFVFIEHVFWVISLNTLFTFLFAFFPYKLGLFALACTGMTPTYFSSAAAVFSGYAIISFFVFIMHRVVRLLRMKNFLKGLGVVYLSLKVFMLVLVEIGIFPVLCGCWLDICSLKLFASTYSSRIAAFTSAPVASVFLHWMIGMVYVFYSASFVILLREIVRPGVLWFMRNLNDPEFNPIQEMIEQPLMKHLRRLGASMILFFSAIMLVVFAPLQLIDKFLPGVLPYNMSLTAETPLSELSVELLILQVVLPALLEQTQARVMIKELVKLWCACIGRVLELDEYLLPMEEDEGIPLGPDNPPLRGGAAGAAGDDPVAAAAAGGGGLAAEHQALLLVRDPAMPATPFVKPPYFGARIVALLAALAVTTVLASLVCFVGPVLLGRSLIGRLSGHRNVHELYTSAVGFYVIWMVLRALMMVAEWVPQGARRIASAIWDLFIVAMKLLVVAIPLIVIIPTVFGVYFQLVFLAPSKVSSAQTPLLFPWQDWAMGILHTKIFGAAVMMGPDWFLKTAFDRMYNNGVMGIRVLPTYRDIVLPILMFMGLQISAPYTWASALVWAAGLTEEEGVVLIRISYPVVLLVGLALSFIHWQYARLMRLAEKIRNDKYLVGTKLMNYEKRKEEERREQLALPAPEEDNVEMERGAEMRDEVMEEEQIEGDVDLFEDAPLLPEERPVDVQ